MLSLLYVSRARLGDDPHGDVRSIIDHASRRNLSNGLTGALVHTGTDFAQVIEGEASAVSRVMADILIDARHERVSIVRRDEVAARSFPNWGMALIGHIPQTQQQIDAVWEAADETAQDAAAFALMDWMQRGTPADFRM